MTHGATFFSAVTAAPWADAAPLARVLDVSLSPETAVLTPAHARALWKRLSYLGSNDLAYLLRGFEGVDYPEIVRDVGKHLKLTELQHGEEERVVELNELLVLAKIFADGWEQLDAGERRELLRELNFDPGHSPLTGAELAAAVLAGRAGDFAIYKLSLIVANSVARALPARALALARRKTAQAVALVASLRQAKRTALAETALADAGAPAASPVAGTGQRKAKRAARKKMAEPAPGPRQRSKKKASKAKRPAPKSSQKKTVTKKVAAKKVAKKASKKRRRPAGIP